MQGVIFLVCFAGATVFLLTLFSRKGRQRKSKTINMETSLSGEAQQRRA